MRDSNDENEGEFEPSERMGIRTMKTKGDSNDQNEGGVAHRSVFTGLSETWAHLGNAQRAGKIRATRSAWKRKKRV